MTEAYKNTTVVIASSERDSVFDCIDSVDGKANIVVSLTPSPSIESRLFKLGIPHVIVPRGNLSVTFNAGIELAGTNKVIVMTDDATFNPGAIDRLSEGLENYDACKARIIFEHDDAKPTTKLVANARDFINSSPTRTYTPGLGIRKDIKSRMGGYFFDQRVRWAEDAEFSHRFHRNGLRFGYVKDATVNHPPVSLTHDLRGAFLIGVSKRRAVDMGIRQGDEDLLPTLKRMVNGVTFERKRRLLHEKGIPTTLYVFVWDAVYNIGYNLRKSKLSGPLEEGVWKHFGRK